MGGYQIWFFLMVVLFGGFLHSNADKQTTSRKRTLRWVTKESALRYLTEDMSQMELFDKNILTPILIERVSGTAGNKEVQEFIKSTMAKLGWTVEEDPFEDNTPHGVKQFNNIIATHDPSKPRKVVIACHFDSKYYEKGKFMGATDSAVPCAIMIETARQLQCLMSKGPKTSSSVKDITLQLLFLDGEEAFVQWTRTDSIYGSRHLAHRWSQEFVPGSNEDTKLSKIREFILLDLIGTSDTQISNHFHDTAELFQQLVKTEGHLKDTGLIRKHSTIFSDRQGWSGIEDDHKPFMEKNVPILHLISTPFPSVWHKMTDTKENLDMELIDDFSRIFRVFVSNLLHLQPEDQGCRKKIHQEL